MADAEGIAEEWKLALCNFNDKIIMRACDEAIRDCKYMPTPAEFIKLCYIVRPKIMPTLSAPARDPDPPEWYTLNLELTDIVKKIHYPSKKWNDPVETKFGKEVNAVAERYQGMVLYEVAQIVNVYKRDVDCPDRMDVPGIKRAIQIANADLVRTEHARTLQ